jgi:hypothetical protein
MTPSQLGQSCADSEGLEEALEVNERNQIRLPGSMASLDGAGGSRSGRLRTTGATGDNEELHDEDRSLQDYTACDIMRHSADEI